VNVTDAPRWEYENSYRTNRHCTLSLLPRTPLRNRRIVLKIRSLHNHCNVSDKGFWTRSNSWVLRYTLAIPIPTHSPSSHSLNTFQVSRYGNWNVCSWVGESAGIITELITSPASWCRKTRFKRGRVRELKNSRNSATVQNRTHVYTKLFDHKDLRNHLLQ
jgi:hypothetical protein